MESENPAIPLLNELAFQKPGDSAIQAFSGGVVQRFSHKVVQCFSVSAIQRCSDSPFSGSAISVSGDSEGQHSSDSGDLAIQQSSNSTRQFAICDLRFVIAIAMAICAVRLEFVHRRCQIFRHVPFRLLF